MLPEVEEAIDKVDDLADSLEQVQDATGNLQDAADQLNNRLNNLDQPAGARDAMGKTASGLSSAAQAGVSAGAGFLGGSVGGALTAGGMGYTALNAAKTMAAGKAVTAIAAGLGAILASGIIGGLIGRTRGKTVMKNTFIGGNGISHGGLNKDSDKEYLYGFSIVPGYMLNPTVYPDKSTSPCTVMPILGSEPALATVGSTLASSGMLTIAEGCGILKHHYVSGSVFSANQKLATEALVTARCYITSSSLSPYSTTS